MCIHKNGKISIPQIKAVTNPGTFHAEEEAGAIHKEERLCCVWELAWGDDDASFLFGNVLQQTTYVLSGDLYAFCKYRNTRKLA